MTAGGAVPEDVVQVWEGHVVSLDEDGFTAHLVDVTPGSEPEEGEAFVPWSSFPDGKPDIVREGTYLRWRIVQGTDGKARDDFTFDIAGTWSADELAQASARGADLSRGLFERKREEAVEPPPPFS